MVTGSCIVFYSHPRESSLTAIFRSLEVCCCSRVYVVSSRRRGGEVKELLKVLKRLVPNVEFKALSIIPDVETDPKGISEVIKVLRNEPFIKESTCFIASAGSRLEVASLSTVIRRELTDIIYVSFLWGPWRGTYYPFTPRPTQVAYVLHPGSELFSECSEGFLRLDGLVELLSMEDVPVLRGEVLKSQLMINRDLSSKCLSTDGELSNCGRLRVAIRFRGRELVSAEVSDYCSWSDVIKLTEVLSSGADDVMSKYGLGSKEYAIVNTLLNVSGTKLLVIRDSIGSDLRSYVGKALIELMRGYEGSLLIDTNVIYAGVHNYLHEEPRLASKLVVPLSTYVEMYDHQVHTDNDPYRVLRAEVSKLLINELSHFKPVVRRDVVVTPSEVGIATTKEYVAVTSDRRAFNNLYKLLGREAVLTESVPVAKVEFLSSEFSRRVAYSYYAIAQLRALGKLVSNSVRRLGIDVEVLISKS